MSQTKTSQSAPVAMFSMAAILRTRRLELGLTQTKLALRLSPDFGARDIAVLESGRIVIPCWSLLQRLGQALELSNDAILVGFLSATNGPDAASDAPIA
jgi:predicted transcriptional regulator